MKEKFKLHFLVNDIWDYVIIEADTIGEARDIAENERSKRNLDVIKNQMWSEQL